MCIESATWDVGTRAILFITAGGFVIVAVAIPIVAARRWRAGFGRG
jgi:hypothetical protein